MHKLISTLAAAFTISVSASSFAATAVNLNDHLVGINGITVGSHIYNVSFGGTFDAKINLYDKAFAQAASTALYNELNLHIKDSDWGFDTKGEGAQRLVAKTDTSYLDTVWHLYPNQDQYQTSWIRLADNNFLQDKSLSNDTYSLKGLTPGDRFVTWTQVSAVPVPASVFMLAPALLGFVVLRRKKRG